MEVESGGSRSSASLKGWEFALPFKAIAMEVAMLQGIVIVTLCKDRSYLATGERH